ncbi:hypothetical protein C1645_829462 [Glomus cerebriforme]|uniref:BTB domain-containing protein n=1 Tax=Glomus cerebriforme TaxID=658196 RepID=A0A397SUC3_9GLOM|nr:hypothetical protein C1645_829462 [Glomus cerebriforme]
MSCNLESEVSKALGKLLKPETDYNVIIHIGEDPDIKKFHAHHITVYYVEDQNIFNDIISGDDIEEQDIFI